jgi:Flp pilus assembly protein TadD
MAWWRNLISGRSAEPSHETDYYQEGVDLLREEKFHDALTSFRLALRENPNDTDVLQQIAVTYTHIGMTDEAVRTYRRVLDLQPNASGAHYGLAFLLLQRGSREDGIAHLKAFLSQPPAIPEAQRHVEHARQTLAEIAAAGSTQNASANASGNASGSASGSASEHG